MTIDHLRATLHLADTRPLYKLLLLTLGLMADSNGRCLTSYDELCQRTGMSERSLRTWLKTAVREGRVEQAKGATLNLRLL